MTAAHLARPDINESVDALTADGGIITIRPVRGDDRRALAAIHGEASPDNLRLRFFNRPSSITLAAEVDRLCQPQNDRHLALVAEEAGAIVGVASCERLGDTDHRADFADGGIITIRPVRGDDRRAPTHITVAVSAHCCWSISRPARGPRASRNWSARSCRATP